MNIQIDDRARRAPVVQGVRETTYARHGLPNQLAAEPTHGVLDVRID